MLCARFSTHVLGAEYSVVPVIPWLPAIPLLAYLFGATLIALAAGLIADRKTPGYAVGIGAVFILCALVLVLPKYAVHPANIGLRTVVFEPLAIGSLAWSLPGVPPTLAFVARYVLALSLVVFGIDHFFALAFIASLIPNWIPWHSFWAAFFGAAFVAAGIAFSIGWTRWAAAGAGAMFALWVVTLHLPRTLGLYGVPGAIHDPNEWSSLIIALALWGGFWSFDSTR